MADISSIDIVVSVINKLY